MTATLYFKKLCRPWFKFVLCSVFFLFVGLGSIFRGWTPSNVHRRSEKIKHNVYTALGYLNSDPAEAFIVGVVGAKIAFNQCNAFVIKEKWRGDTIIGFDKYCNVQVFGLSVNFDKLSRRTGKLNVKKAYASPLLVFFPPHSSLDNLLKLCDAVEDVTGAREITFRNYSDTSGFICGEHSSVKNVIGTLIYSVFD